MWIIGDIHGRLHTLKALVDLIPQEEDIICTGDLIDRGLWSTEVIEFVRDTKRMSSVLGNHDEFIVVNDAYNHIRNGGRWYFHTEQNKKDELRNYLLTLPISKLIKVDGHEAVVTHAPMSSPSRDAMLWERDIMADLVPEFNIFGHNIVDEPVVLDDRAAIDTGMEKLTAIHWPSLKILSMKTKKEDVDPIIWEKINEKEIHVS